MCFECVSFLWCFMILFVVFVVVYVVCCLMCCGSCYLIVCYVVVCRCLGFDRVSSFVVVPSRACG